MGNGSDNRDRRLIPAKVAVAILVFLGLVATFLADRFLAIREGHADLYGALPAVLIVLGAAGFAAHIVSFPQIAAEELVLLGSLVVAAAIVGVLGLLANPLVALVDLTDTPSALAWICVRSVGWTLGIAAGVLLWHYEMLRKERRKLDAARGTAASR